VQDIRGADVGQIAGRKTSPLAHFRKSNISPGSSRTLADRAVDGPECLGQQRRVVDRLAQLPIREFKHRHRGEAHHRKAGQDDETDALRETLRWMSRNAVYMTFETRARKPISPSASDVSQAEDDAFADVELGGDREC